MCRSIKTLRPPYTPDATADDVTAAALQYVRKVAGMLAPAKVNAEAFAAAVVDVARSTQVLLDTLVVRPTPPSANPTTPAGNPSTPVGHPTT